MEKTGSVEQNRAVIVDETVKVVVAVASQPSQLITGQLDSNRRVFDLQLSNMLTITAASSIPDPETSYQYGLLTGTSQGVAARQLFGNLQN